MITTEQKELLIKILLNDNDTNSIPEKKISKNLENNNNNINNTYDFIGEYRLIRTYSAGVWFGRIKSYFPQNLINLIEARRLYYWEAEKSISLSAIALYGLRSTKKFKNLCRGCFGLA